MNKLKKLMVLALAIAMVLAMGVTVFAAPSNVNLTVPNETGHTYEVFQIFTGDLSTDDNGNKILSDVKWGANGKETAGTTVNDNILTTLGGITSSTSSADQSTIDNILSALGMSKNDLDDANAFKKDVAAGSTESVPTGYYIVKDKNESLEGSEDSYTLLLISVVGPTTLTAKADTTTSEKKVMDINDSTETTVGGLQDSADYDIGDAVPFVLKATLADNVSAYKKYHLTFVDELESGKFDAISDLTIKVDGVAVASVTGYTATVTGESPTKDGFTKTITFEPTGTDTYLPTDLNGKDVTIEFTATLGEGAAIGKPGNKNEFTLKFSNNPNDDQGEDEGETPKDIVKVFTYKLTVNKVDEENEALAGADFTLYKKVADTETEDAETGEDIKDALAGTNASIKADALEDEAYYVVVGHKTGDATGSTFSFNGIDDGTYVLVETTIPSGYNAWDAVSFDVEAEHDEDSDNPQLTSLTGGDLVSGEFKDTGIITTNIVNESGAELPSTGGIGTVIFYVLGSMLVIGCGIVLISKKRMESK